MIELLLRAKIWQDALWEDLRGQDLGEYALMSGFVATAAGALMPDVAEALQRGEIEQGERKVLHFNITMDRVLDNFHRFFHRFTKESSYTWHKSIE